MIRSADEQKEDIRLRMAELEKRLAESEEERCKLEKTCSVLMRAFREEEKLQYKALNKRYEKFLEDCSVRRRRNEIVLRSLCRIEDRSRALFAKTERLKLLRDRYVSYLKMSRLKQDEGPSHFWGSLPIASRDASYDVTSEPLRWKTSALARPREDLEVKADLSKNLRPTSNSRDTERSPGFQEHEGPREPIRRDVDLDYYFAVEAKGEEMVRGRSRILRGAAADDEPREVRLGGGAEGVGEGGSVEVRYPPSERADPKRQGPGGSEAIKPNETDSLKGAPGGSDHAVASGVGGSADDEESGEQSRDVELSEERDVPGDNVLPRGLDGVDYQNETYPESYYEQPVRHQNHLSIASDVILEEDETEQDVEGEEEGEGEEKVVSGGFAGEGGGTWEQGRLGEGRGGVGGLEAAGAWSGGREGDGEGVEEAEGGECGSEGGSLGKLSGGCSDEARGSAGERAVGGMSERSHAAAKSNLMHMLESDSESFQIEHGDGVSGNEDSDFDFSFNKN